jgi:hypothetical protein
MTTWFRRARALFSEEAASITNPFFRGLPDDTLEIFAACLVARMRN